MLYGCIPFVVPCVLCTFINNLLYVFCAGVCPEGQYVQWKQYRRHGRPSWGRLQTVAVVGMQAMFPLVAAEWGLGLENDIFFSLMDNKDNTLDIYRPTELPGHMRGFLHRDTREASYACWPVLFWSRYVSCICHRSCMLNGSYLYRHNVRYSKILKLNR